MGYGFNKRIETLSYLHYSSNAQGCKLKYLYGLSVQVKQDADIRQQGTVPTVAIYRVHALHKEGNCYSRACVLSCFSHVWLSATLWSVACQAPLSIWFPRQEYWSGLPFPSPGDLPNPGMETASCRSPAEKALAPHSSPLAWKVPWMEEPMGSRRVGHNWATSFSLSCIGEGNGNPLQCFCLVNLRDGRAGGLPPMGSHRVEHDWSDLAAAAADLLHWQGGSLPLEPPRKPQFYQTPAYCCHAHLIQPDNLIFQDNLEIQIWKLSTLKQ